MIDDANQAPLHYRGVMVSSTFDDLTEHREALMRAIQGQGMFPVAMENDAALPAGTVIDSSLRKVREAAAYAAIISHRYGTIPDTSANPDRLSLTELEFREARRLGRPILLFVMTDDHRVTRGAVETDPEKMLKLAAFRADAKRASDGSAERVYATFSSVEEFETRAVQSAATLHRLLHPTTGVEEAPANTDDRIPRPPDLYAEPRYIGSHDFVGRNAQLTTLNDWASASHPHPVLLFEAIGGAGKSMLTWEWTTRHASAARDDWAGRFWYSFYEKGAVMSDFCRRALAYMTGQPVDAFRKKRQRELSELLRHHLQARPWLLVLDGLERVLVAYHRYDAAQIADEDAGSSDEIAERDPCAAIRTEDDDLLRYLAGAAPSKILITSRLLPRVLLNPSGQPIPGVLHERLPGLRPPDAEQLLRACGVRGDSHGIRTYLQRHCDCHPLVTGIIGGLVINDYLPDRGNFDAWAEDPGYGGRLDLADLDLIQKRNHILESALNTLPEKSRQLLAVLALLPESVDYETLLALNPHAPWAPYDFLVTEPDVSAAPSRLAETVRDLERRGLLQYDRQVKRYDLHPVVRGVTIGSLRADDRDELGQRVVDHFSQRSQDPFEEVESLEDLQDALILMKTLLRMGRTKEAYPAYRDRLSTALAINLEAYAETLALVRPFFTHDWEPVDIEDAWESYLLSAATIALNGLGERNAVFRLCQRRLEINLRLRSWHNLATALDDVTISLWGLGRRAAADRISVLSLWLNEAVGDEQGIFMARFYRFEVLAWLGKVDEALAVWEALAPMGRDWQRNRYRPGSAEVRYAQFQFVRGRLTDDLLTQAERLARQGRSRILVRELHRLRGDWLTQQQKWASAADSYREAIRLAHEAGLSDSTAELRLALARLHAGDLDDADEEARRLAKKYPGRSLDLARLWWAIGNRDQATRNAVAAYRWAWGEGEPFVHRFELDQVGALLDELGVQRPDLPPYDPTRDERFDWEDAVVAVSEQLRAERADE
ncbi:DUF4062 domain-containing protein [Cryptosporangium aurantiacum]|uniref:DUF4062 domain-containing protein n=1 Tax=Cryptosporangium aurantiacum TaxID=134849 RepID=A0A1M7M7M1_9ACTN|nr:DUF4062 domain-containing protein [Cryptosporangium aurantiacum]SHM86663.1 protein of unknown function [Cryptosporangium aurantiacum]